MAKRKQQTKPRTRGDAPERAAAVVGPIKREPAPLRNTAVGMPVFDLKGGPYDGMSLDDDRLDSILYFPTEVHVVGADGPGVYVIDGTTATYDRPA